MNSYILYWLDGVYEKVSGESIEDAFSKAGHSRGAMKALDFFDTASEVNYTWNSELRSWVTSIESSEIKALKLL